MRVAIIQSSYLPWRGYFDIIDSVDKFVFLDDVQYTRRSWRTRNQVKTSNGIKWITVPVEGASRSKNICEMRLDNQQEWRKTHLSIFEQNYREAPFFKDAETIFREIMSNETEHLSSLNQFGVNLISKYLQLDTELICSSTLGTGGAKTDKLLAILRSVGASEYVSGPSAKAYLDEEQLFAHGISVFYKSYSYPEYSQLHGNFDGAVTVLDLIANCGADSNRYLKSLTPDVQAMS